MTESNTPLVLVVCNDYGELALAMYLLDQQSFAQNTTLMLPPGLHAKNPDVLPGRTFVYHSLDDIRKEMESRTPGILGLFSGYLLPIHRLCAPDELGSLLSSTQAQGWKSFTSDPFLGLLEDVGPSELVKINLPKWSIIWSIYAAIGNKRLAAERLAAEQQVAGSMLLLTEMRRVLKGMLHVYPCGESSTETERSSGPRLHFHNSAFLSQPKQDPSAPMPKEALGQQRWLFVLGDQDYAVQEEKYGQTIWAKGAISRKFREVLLLKLHDTLEAGRVPTLVAPAKVIDSVRKHSPAADSMKLLVHCDYPHFQSLLREAEYVFYWNAVSFTCIQRTLTGKPWFTFDDGHLLKGMSADYASRITEWFYRGGVPPRLDVSITLTCDMLQQANEQYLKSAWRVRQGLLDSPAPRSLFSALDPDARRPDPEAQKSVSELFEILQQLGEIVAANELDGNFVVDTALLPYPKSDIRDAVTLLLDREIGDEAAFARSAVLTLAFFQPGVGEGRHAIDTTGPDGEPWRTAVEADMLAIIESLPNQETQKSISEAFEILQQLGEVVSANNLDGNFVVDTALLPHSKSDIHNAVTLLIEEGAEEQAAFARSVVLTLAFFRPGVGEGRHALDSQGADGESWRTAVEADMLVISEGLPNQEMQKSMQAALEILQQLGEVVSANKLDGSFVVDATLLAHSKSDIRTAVTLLLKGGAEDQAEFARSAVLTLAFFQPGVGEGKHALDSPGADGKPWRTAVEAELFLISEGLPK
jgi:hypothetical protein